MLKNKKLIFIYLLTPLVISGCFFNTQTNNSTDSQTNKDSKSTWSDKSQNTNQENTNTSTDQNNNISSSTEKNNDDVVINGVTQAKPTPEAKKFEEKQIEEANKVSDIAIKYVSNSKKYLRSSRSLPQVTNIETKDCRGCFLVSLEYDVIDPQNPGNLIIEFVELKIEDWKVVAPLDI